MVILECRSIKSQNTCINSISVNILLLLGRPEVCSVWNGLRFPRRSSSNYLSIVWVGFLMGFCFLVFRLKRCMLIYHGPFFPRGLQYILILIPHLATFVTSQRDLILLFLTLSLKVFLAMDLRVFISAVLHKYSNINDTRWNAFIFSIHSFDYLQSLLYSSIEFFNCLPIKFRGYVLMSPSKIIFIVFLELELYIRKFHSSLEESMMNIYNFLHFRIICT